MEKSGHELVLEEALHEKLFPISGCTIGYVRDLVYGRGLDVGLGAQITLNDFPRELQRYYGDSPAYGFQFFFRLRPSRMTFQIEH